MHKVGSMMSLEADDENSKRETGGKSGEHGYVHEIFCSIQGEGLFLGERQIFLRTAGCSTACSYCDTEESRKRTPYCSVIKGEEERSFSNPLTVELVVRVVGDLAAFFSPVKTVCITGGEPLEQSRFVAAVAKAIKEKGHFILLETNGIEVAGLKETLQFVDIISMDIKLPTGTGRSYWTEHGEFLHHLRKQDGKGRDVYVKVVIGGSTRVDEFKEAVALVSKVDRSIPLVLQPESTTFLSENEPADAREALSKKLLHYQAFALNFLSDVRVIPQCHKILGVR